MKTTDVQKLKLMQRRVRITKKFLKTLEEQINKLKQEVKAK